MVAALFGLLTSFVWRRLPALTLRLPAQRAALLAGCLAAFFYVLLAGFAVPAQRTLYMLLVAALAMGSGRVVAPSRTLSLALLVVLLFTVGRFCRQLALGAPAPERRDRRAFCLSSLLAEAYWRRVRD